ncbi:hypothetical protein CMI38_03305 [Candidatus Pacearchaeota archaeon]|jgi:hypothetical protein|nr:hypothetical protein [Candidatus Pacearchaeota archaeon]|tara:strand:+ start:356 stop:1069 length:714 start_codon:yes stop_codon:yes gene_type:complete
MNLNDNILKSQEDLKTIKVNQDSIIVKAKFGPSKETTIPLILSEELSFFIATIIGDGHLKKDKKQIIIELSDKKLLEFIQEICINIFNRSFNIKKIKPREGRKLTHAIYMDSKAIHNLLNQTFEIPTGNKSNIVYIPGFIRNSDYKIKASFLSGIMMTEGGKRRKGFGLSTSSKNLWKDLIKIFNELGIKVLIDKWIYKKYNKEYYGFYFKKEKIELLAELINNKKMSKLLLNRFTY